MDISDLIYEISFEVRAETILMLMICAVMLRSYAAKERPEKFSLEQNSTMQVQCSTS